MLYLDPDEHKDIFDYLKKTLPALAPEVPDERKEECQFLRLTELQDALLSIPAFIRMTGNRRLGVECLKRAMFLAFPMSTVGLHKKYHRRIVCRQRKGAAKLSNTTRSTTRSSKSCRRCPETPSH